MRWRKLVPQFRRSARKKGLKGATMVEVAIAVVVFGLVLATLPPILLMLLNAEFKQNESRVCEGLVRCQIEYIKSAPYDEANGTHDPEYATVPVPNPSYEIDVVAIPISLQPEWSDEEQRFIITREPLDGRDEGIQEVTVTVYHVDKVVLTAKNYKVNR